MHLIKLGIDSDSLHLIQIYLNKCEYCTEEIVYRRSLVLSECIHDSWTYNFICDISIERLLLLVLAIHKLEIKGLQKIVNARVAEILHVVEKDDGQELFGIELCDDEDLNNFLKYDNKWAVVESFND